MESTLCPLCGSSNREEAETLRWKGEDLIYAICRECGLKYMSRRPTAEWYAQFYRDEFWQESRLQRRSIESETSNKTTMDWKEDGISSDELEKRVARSRKRQIWRAQRIWRITKKFSELGPESTVLEIGAGWGKFLELAIKETGCLAAAVEPSEMARQYMSETLGVTLAARSFEEIGGLDDFKGKTNLVVCSHVLENTIDPIDNLRNIRNLLSPQGIVYIDTCNLYYNNAINPYHPYVFSPETLRSILLDAGLEPVYMEHEAHPARVSRVGDIQKAKYLAVVARKGESKRLIERPEMVVSMAQEKGEILMSRARKLHALRKFVKRLFSFGAREEH